MNKKTILIPIIILNAILLLGQLWPAGAPPFARTVNIATLVLNLILFVMLFSRKK